MTYGTEKESDFHLTFCALSLSLALFIKLGEMIVGVDFHFFSFGEKAGLSVCVHL